VDSAPGSPAWLNGLQTGFWIRSINDRPFDDFERSGGGVGDVVILRAEVPGIGPVIRSLTLSAEPSKARSPRQKIAAKRQSPAWKREAPVLAGKRVFKDARPALLEFAAAHPHVKRHIWLLVHLLKREWRKGIIVKHETIAKAVGCHVSRVKRAQSCCEHFGFLRVISGKRSRKYNTYEVCWPSDARKSD
jgi:hypothetical protein